MMVIFCTMTSFFFAAQTQAYEITVIKSKDSHLFNLFLKGFKETVPDAVLRVLNLNGDVNNAKKIKKTIRATGPDLIIPLGAKAAWVLRDEPAIPVLFSMVNEPKKYKLSKFPGVQLDFPPGVYLDIAKEIVPQIRKVGLIHSDPRLISEIKKIARKRGLTIKAINISSLEDIKNKVDRLLSQVDILWVYPDPILMKSPRLINEMIILRALKKRIPTIASNKWLVRSGGALFSVFGDYHDIGKQTGNMVQKLRAKTLSPIKSPESPKKRQVFLNKSVFDRLNQHLNIKVPNNAFFSE